jgi:hypothetical protein
MADIDNATEQINRYQELVDVIKPILNEMGHLKKLVDDKTFKTLTKRLEKYR